MAEEKLTIPLASIAAYCALITADLLMKLGQPPTVATVRAFRRATTEAIRNGALEAAPEDYRDQIELLKAHETSQRLIGERKDEGHAETEIS
jgi:hypothetical protein